MSGTKEKFITAANDEDESSPKITKEDINNTISQEIARGLADDDMDTEGFKLQELLSIQSRLQRTPNGQT